MNTEAVLTVLSIFLAVLMGSSIVVRTIYRNRIDAGSLVLFASAVTFLVCRYAFLH